MATRTGDPPAPRSRDGPGADDNRRVNKRIFWNRKALAGGNGNKAHDPAPPLHKNSKMPRSDPKTAPTTPAAAEETSSFR